MQDWVDIVDGWKGIKMKTKTYFYIERMIKNLEDFRRESRWGLRKWFL